MLSALSGAPLNSAEVGRLLGISPPTAVAYLRELEEVGLVTCLPFFGGGGRPWLVAWEDPSSHASLLHTLQAACPGSRFFWWRRSRRKVVDIIVDLGAERVGFCITPSFSPPQHRDWAPLESAICRGVVSRAFLLGFCDYVSRRLEAPIFCLPLRVFRNQARDWMFTWREPAESWQAMVRTGRALRRPRRYPACPAVFP